MCSLYSLREFVLLFMHFAVGAGGSTLPQPPTDLGIMSKPVTKSCPPLRVGGSKTLIIKPSYGYTIVPKMCQYPAIVEERGKLGSQYVL
jgi:hypothetical protein